MMRLIVTRPEPDANRTAQALRALGHEAIVSPVLDISADLRAALPKEEVQAVLVTSSNAVRALSAHPEAKRLAGARLFAVGDRTALEAKRAGFARARSAGGDVDALAGVIAAELDPASGPLLYAAGDVQAGDLAGRLEGSGFRVQTAILYQARVRTRLAPAAAEALRGGSVDGVLVFSRRSAMAFASVLRADGLAPLAPHVICFCISQAAAEPLAAVTAGPIRVAARPDQLSLFALMERTT
jgi:uroporphyrinogen-III synthase